MKKRRLNLNGLILIWVTFIFLLLTSCDSKLSNREMIEGFINKLAEADSMTCIKSIKFDDKTVSKMNRCKKDISNAIFFLQTHNKPVFSNFKDSIHEIRGNLQEHEYIYKFYNEKNDVYFMKFEFMNFIPDKIYNFSFYKIHTSDSIPQFNIMNKEFDDIRKQAR